MNAILCGDVFFSWFSDSHRFHVINAFQKGDLASCLDLIDHLLWLAGYVPPNIFLNWASYLYALHQAECAPQPSSERRRADFQISKAKILVWHFFLWLLWLIDCGSPVWSISKAATKRGPGTQVATNGWGVQSCRKKRKHQKVVKRTFFIKKPGVFERIFFFDSLRCSVFPQ